MPLVMSPGSTLSAVPALVVDPCGQMSPGSTLSADPSVPCSHPSPESTVVAQAGHLEAFGYPDPAPAMPTHAQRWS